MERMMLPPRGIVLPQKRISSSLRIPSQAMIPFADHSCPRLLCDGFSTKHRPQCSPRTYLTDGPLDGSDSCCLLPPVGRLLALIYLRSARSIRSRRSRSSAYAGARDGTG